jgi:hypothetical protein
MIGAVFTVNLPVHKEQIRRPALLLWSGGVSVVHVMGSREDTRREDKEAERLMIGGPMRRAFCWLFQWRVFVDCE